MPIRIQTPQGIVEFPDGMSEQDMASALSTLQPAQAAPAEKGWGETISEALPTVGGMAGSLLGGSKMSPVGMALAGVGGAAGEAFKQVADSVRGDFSDVPETVMGRLQKIAGEGIKQGGLEAGGRVIGAAVQPVAKALYGLALRPSKALMRDAGGGKLLKGVRRIVDQGYGDNVMPSGMGVGRADRLVKASVNEATQIAARSPQKVSTQRVMQRATDDQAKRAVGELTSTGIAPKTDKIAEQMGNLIDANPAEMSMSQLLQVRRGAEDVAAPVFKAAKLPGGPGRVATGSEPSVARSISGAAKQTLDDVLGAPFQKVNQRTQARSAVKSAVDDASSRPNMLTNLLAGSVGVASSGGDPMEAAKNGIMLRLLFSPTALGGTALGIGKAPYSQLLRTAQLAQLQGQE